jgi:methylglutaconyl-CoA hydratase
MTDGQTLAIARDDRGIVTLHLNQPGKRNALSSAMIDEITEFATRCNADKGIRAIVLRGAGPVFCAGADLGWMMAQINAGRDARMAEARRLAAMFQALNTLASPLIAYVHGGAYGGALGLLSVCDVVLADPGTAFGFTETRLGIIPATIAPYVIARLGEGPARRVFMSARIFGAEEALALGLVSRMAPLAEAEVAIEAEVQPYLAVAPGAVARAKRLARALGTPITPERIEASITALADAWETDEAREGIAAFLEKRKANWA